MVQVGGILLLFSRKAGKDGPKISLCVSMVLGFFFNMAKLPFHIETPFLFVLPENIRNSHFKIKCQTLDFFFFGCCCCYSFTFDFLVFWIFF